MKSVPMIIFLMLFFLGALMGCPEKEKLTPDPVPVDLPQVRLSFEDLMGFEGRMAPHAGPARYALVLLA